jgi:hypothetical protein
MPGARIPGPPLTPQDLISYLISEGITVGIGPQGILIGEGSWMNTWAAQNLRFDAGWVSVEQTHQLWVFLSLDLPTNMSFFNHFKKDPGNIERTHIQSSSVCDRLYQH